MKLSTRNKNIIKAVGLASVGSLLMVEPSLAADITSVSNTVKTQVQSVSDVIGAVSYVAGIGFAVKAALKFKEHNESKGQVPLSQPVTLAVVAAILLMLPTFMGVAANSVFGTGGTQNTIDGSAVRNISR